MSIDISAVYKSTIEHFKQAQNNIAIEKRTFEHSAAAISDVIPGFEADKLEFGSYDKENYAVLFVDMRRSTQRAQQVGPEKTFLDSQSSTPVITSKNAAQLNQVVTDMIEGIIAEQDDIEPDTEG